MEIDEEDKKSSDLSEFFSVLSKEKDDVRQKIKEQIDDPESGLSGLFLQLEEALQDTKEVSVEEDLDNTRLSDDDHNKLENLSSLLNSLSSDKQIPIKVEPEEIIPEEVIPEELVVESEEPQDITEPQNDIITSVIRNLDDMSRKTQVKEEVDQISSIRKEFDNFRSFISQQIGSLQMSGAGSGETRLEFLDDVDRATAKVDGKALVYDSGDGKWKGESVLTAAITGLDIDGGTDIGADLVDADLFIVDDGAGGTNRKTAASRIKTYVADVTLTTAAQTNITSLGTLSALQVDNLNINGNTISSTAGTDLLITPLSGQQIVLDGAIVIDAGVVTGGTSITSTAFVGNLTGTVATATQNSITTATGLVSVGALNSGSITSGFTSIDVGAGAISTTGAIIGGSVAGRKTLVTTFNTNSAVSASLTAAQSGATILIDGTENNVINLPNAATTNPGIFYDLIVRVAVASDKTTIVNIHGSGGNFVGALSLAGGTAANAVFDNGGDALTFVNSTVIGSRARITCLIDDGTDGVWQVECLASPIATIA